MTSKTKHGLPQTRLGAACRALATTMADGSVEANELNARSKALNLAAYSTGKRGEDVKQLASYRVALRAYNRIAAKPYDGSL